MSLVEPVLEIPAAVLLAIGVFFYFTGALGLLRFPDVYNRIHASTKTTTAGIVSILLGGILLFGFDPIGVKAVAIIVFLLLTYPVAGHLLARAAYRTGVVLTDRTVHDEYRHVWELQEELPGEAPEEG